MKRVYLVGLMVLFVAALFAVGFIPFFMLEWETFAPFGDGFGFMGAMFSGLALLGILITLHYQMEAVDDARAAFRHARRSNRKQLLAAQLAARIQALTFLAEMHGQMIRAEGEDQAGHKRQCQYYASRAIDLMTELGETFPGNPNAVAIGGQTDVELAVGSLRQILQKLKSALSACRSDTRNERANNALAETERELTDWLRRYRSNLTTAPISNCLSLFTAKRTNVVEIKPQMDAFWEKTNATVQKFEAAVEQVASQNS